MEGLPSYGVLNLSENDDGHVWSGVRLYETEAEAILEANSLAANDGCHYIKRLVILVRKDANHYAEHYEWRPGLRPEWVPEGMEGMFPDE